MLFKASITDRVLKSEDLLSEQLYIFLRNYVPTRLRYESNDEIEDCIQETIMYLFKRYNGLDKKEADKLLAMGAIEKFFYNRAHSFVSLYLTKLKTRRRAINNYIENYAYVNNIDSSAALEDVDLGILKDIVNSFNLDKEKSLALLKVSESRLKELGYNIPHLDLSGIPQNTYDLVDTLSFSVIDEYMIKSIV